MKSNPLDKYKAVAGEQSIGDLSIFEEAVLFHKELKNYFILWVEKWGADDFDDTEKQELLSLLIIYEDQKKAYDQIIRRNKALSPRIVAGKRDSVVSTMQGDIEKMLDHIVGINPEIRLSDETIEVGRKLIKIKEDADNIIPKKIDVRQPNKKAINDFLKSFKFPQEAIKELHDYIDL